MRFVNVTGRPELIGQEAEVVRIIRTPEAGLSSDVLPMAYVRVVSTGENVLVFPEQMDTLPSIVAADPKFAPKWLDAILNLSIPFNLTTARVPLFQS